MDMRYVPTSNASTLLKAPGMQIDAWELFHTTPVRRRIEQDRSVESTSRTVRETIAVLALANPRTSFTLRIQNLLILHTPRAARLSIDHVCTAVDDGRAQPWLPVSFMHHAISFVGFISGSGLPHTRAQFVSIDGLPVTRSAYHDAFTKACRAWLGRHTTISQKSNSLTPARRHPAFAVNVITGFRPFVASVSQQHQLATSVSHFKNLDVLIHQNVINILSGRNVEPPEESKQLRSREELSKTPIPPSSVTKKRRRFEDADLTHSNSVDKYYPRLIPPVSCAQSHVHSGRITCLKKTFSSSISSRKAGPKSRGMGLRASEVEQAFRKHVAGWCNPCFQALGSTNRPLQKKNRMSANKSTHDNEPTGKWVAVSKTHLSNMRVVGQVDNKFIIVMSKDDATLYALDQHAVSERILFERLLRNAENDQGIRAATLNNTKKVSVSKTQRAILLEKRVQIERWGWRIHQPGGDDNIEDDDPVTISLSHVPKVTGLNGHELIIAEDRELVSYADELLDGAAVTGCLPKVLIEAMASVACHSAVRFGDRLSKQQCEHLLFDGLSECQNPFACAHGRPSIVPLAVLDDGAPSLTS